MNDIQIPEQNAVPSKNSLIAKSGFEAEKIFRTNNTIKTALEKHYKNKISNIEQIQGKKYDTKITFENGTTLKIQNKKIENTCTRGDSFDRRPIKYTFANQFLRKYLTLLTIVRKSKTETSMSDEQKTDFIKMCNANIPDIVNYLSKTLLGENNEMNENWCIMKTNKKFENVELYVLSSAKLFEFIRNSIHIDIKMKKNGTCLHVSPNIYLQRKGGGNTDKSPNDIQAKFKITQEILDLCDRIL